MLLSAALLLLRLGVGLTFAAHGAQKAFGWWSGPGPEGWRGAIARMGYRPTEVFVALSVGVELIGGLLLAIGLVTPLVAAIIVAQTVVIIAQVHWSKGFFNAGGGYEFPLLLGVVAAAICLAGPGSYSVDALFRLALPDLVRLTLLPLAVIGGMATYVLPRQTAAADTPAGPREATQRPTAGRGRPTERRRRSELRRN